MELPYLDLKTYQYELPADRIAQYPLTPRDASKLLVYKAGKITHEKFAQIGHYLPSATTLVFNNTKVIPARLFFTKDTGALIEIFLLAPLLPSIDLQVSMQASEHTRWSCMIGNQKRWKQNQELRMNLKLRQGDLALTAHQIGPGEVEFTWDPSALTFSEVLDAAGKVPLPPYMKRASEDLDSNRYQTVYSKLQGAVAAPTAGLHFTNDLLQSLRLQGINEEYLTLHVGAGTFQPIKVNAVAKHPMHGEQMVILRSNIQALLAAKQRVVVGTTSLRTLESLYWYGVKLLNQGPCDFFIDKLLPYQKFIHLPDFNKALQAILEYMDAQDLTTLRGYTELFIFPPYRIKSVCGLITNFHLPGSTLILLVAAFVGPAWRDIYQAALDRDYRFLSYGDSSLLLNPNQT